MDIQKFLEHPYINHQQHPLYPELYIFNYSKVCSFARAWDEYTTLARGLILHESGRVIARPFQKFFNLGEPLATIDLLPTYPPEVTEKMDGSLGILFEYDGLLHVATRGSFTSEQAVIATQKIRLSHTPSNFVPGYTYLFEIIYPANRVVVDYGYRNELVLLAIISNQSGLDVSFKVVKAEAERLQFSTPRRFDLNTPELIEKAKTLSGNEEGFVLRWGSTRVKVKGDEYIMLHRSRFGLSNKWVYDRIVAGEPLLTPDVPEEFTDYIEKTAAAFYTQFNKILYEAKIAVKVMEEYGDRKSQAEAVLNDPIYSKISGLIFGLLDGKDITKSIWRMLKPKFEKYTPEPVDNRPSVLVVKDL